MNKPLQSSRSIAWLRLARVSALPSAISNILAGYLLVNGDWTPTVNLVLLILCSSCLFTSGMILNDYFDFEIDSIERPRRPLTSGEISRRAALWAGMLLVVLAIILAGSVAWQNQLARPVTVAALLALCVLLYDGPLKRTFLAPVTMGACRTLNILLGASTFCQPESSYPGWFTLPAIIWWVAISVGVFVAGITILARNEAVGNQNRLPLIVGAITITLGIAALALVPFCPNEILNANNNLLSLYPLVIGLIALPILRRVLSAVLQGDSKTTQLAVISCLRSIIIFDAALCFLVAPDRIHYALVVVGLLIPALILSRTIPST